jgi:pyruvate/2-oxoglutarate dehydrogenase complex dihydrolipoamide acyltransferase (E2) component
VVVKLIYDHRVLDGAYIARRLADIEAALHGPVAEELRQAAAVGRDRRDAAAAVEPLLRPHLGSAVPDHRAVDPAGEPRLGR